MAEQWRPGSGEWKSTASRHIICSINSTPASSMPSRLLAVLATNPDPPKYPYDHEPYTDAERKAVAEAAEWLKHNEPIPLETVPTSA